MGYPATLSSIRHSLVYSGRFPFFSGRRAFYLNSCRGRSLSTAIPTPFLSTAKW